MLRRMGKRIYMMLPLSALLLGSCAMLKKQPQSPAAAAPAGQQEITFIDGISTSREPRVSEHTSKTRGTRLRETPGHVNGIEEARWWQFKYAQLLDLPVENVVNEKLFNFIEEWYGVPYRMGGSTKDGIDCSNFVNTFMSAVFQISLAGNSVQLFNQVSRLGKRSDLKYGDLVFFAINRKKRISHVGVYLDNDRFVHASSSSGVMISDLREPYWVRYYAGAGRIN